MYLYLVTCIARLAAGGRDLGSAHPLPVASGRGGKSSDVAEEYERTLTTDAEGREGWLPMPRRGAPQPAPNIPKQPKLPSEWLAMRLMR